MALTTSLRVLIEGDASGLIGQLTKAGRASKGTFSEVSRSAKAEFAAASREADKAFKEIAQLQSKLNRANKGGQPELANALSRQMSVKQAEYDKLSAVAIAAERRIQTEAIKTAAAHATEAAGVSKLGGAYAQQGGAVSRFLGAFTGSAGGATKGVDALKEGVTGLSKGTGVLGGVTSAASSGLSALGTSAGLSGKGLGVAAIGATAAAVGIGLIGKTVASGIEHFITYAREVNKVKNIVGGTTEDASLLAGQFRHFGVDVDVASKSLAIFATNAVNNGGKKLQALGVDIARTKDGSVDLNKTLLNAGDTFKRYGTSAEGAALAKGAFGRGGTAIIPILKTEREELEAINRATSKQGLKFSDKERKDALALGIAIREVGHSWEGLQVQAAKGLAPLFTEQTEGASNFLDTINVVTQKVGGLGGIMKKLSGEEGLGGLAKLGAKALPGVGQAVSFFEGFAGQTSQASKDQAVLQAALSDTQEEASGFVAQMLSAGYSLEEVNLKIKQSGKSMEELEAGASIAPVFDKLAHHITMTGNAAKFAGEEATSFKSKLDILGQGAISLASTQTSVAASFDSLNTSLKDNGTNFDNNTEKGRDNRKALETHSSGILANISAMQTQGATVGEVSAKWDEQVGALTRTLQAAGLTDVQIQALLRDYGLIPATKSTLIDAQTAEAKRRLAEVIAQLNQLQNTDVSVNISGGIAAGAIHFGGSSSTARGVGGPVQKRREYQVAEHGQELFVAQQKNPQQTGVMAHLKRSADEGAHESLVRLGIPGGIEPKATRKGAPALLLGGQGPQMFTPPSDGVIVNATDTKRLQRTNDEDVISRILKKAGADRGTLSALAGASAPKRGGGGRVEKDQTYQVAERGKEAYVSSFDFGPKKSTPSIAGPGIKRQSDGSYIISVGDTHLTVEAGTEGSAKGVNKRDVDRIVERKQAELVAELVAAMRTA